MPENLVLQCNFITGLTGQFLVTSDDRVNNLKRLDLYNSKPLPTCMICGNTHFPPTARYCKICGTEVTHFTTREILRIVYSKLSDSMNKCQSGHENDRNARYCEFCGVPQIKRCFRDAGEKRAIYKVVGRVRFPEKIIILVLLKYFYLQTLNRTCRRIEVVHRR